MSSSQEYGRARNQAKEILESEEHDAMYLCATSVDETGVTDIEVVSGIDSDRIQDGKGFVRLQQAAMHFQYLADISGLSPVEVAGEIASVIENGEVTIDVKEERCR